MARWRSTGGRIEAPEWYRNFHPESWDEPDAERRWAQAKHAYRQAHPAFGEQEFEDLMAEIRNS